MKSLYAIQHDGRAFALRFFEENEKVEDGWALVYHCTCDLPAREQCKGCSDLDAAASKARHELVENWWVTKFLQENKGMPMPEQTCQICNALQQALELLLADVQDYEAWQRPVHAVDVARAAIAKKKGIINTND
jgi:hypothetical protein